MSLLLVATCYLSAIAVSLFFLWHFGVKHLLLHLLAAAAALVLGSVPLASPWNTPAGTLAVGWLFLLLMVWGIAGLLQAATATPKHFHFHHR